MCEKRANLWQVGAAIRPWAKRFPDLGRRFPTAPIAASIRFAPTPNATAVATGGRNGEVRFVGEVDSSPESMRRLINRITTKRAHALF